MKAIDLLRVAVESYEPYLQESGELHDPVLGEPTQYGTPCHALGQAVLASHDPTPRHSEHLMYAFRGLDASLRTLNNSNRPHTASALDPSTGTVSALDHRSYFWAPVIKTYRHLKRHGVSMADAFTTRIAGVDIERAFTDRPLDGRAAAWLAGEWIRMRENLSPVSPVQFDLWLGALLDHCALVDLGFCQVPGHSNAEDLFIRFYLADLLAEEYQGAHYDRLHQLMQTGLQRSLATQLSDGSLASAHINAGQTWTVACMVAYFTHAAAYFDGSAPELADAAKQAARRALSSLARWQRADEPFSPVENLFSPNFRIGYEPFTLDGHYGNLAIAFLAKAILHGCDDEPLESKSGRAADHHIDPDPLHRAMLHEGPYSIHINGAPNSDYDGFGITDLTFGPNRFFHFASTVRHVDSGSFFNLGMAMRDEAGRSPIRSIASEAPGLLTPIERGLSDASLRVRARTRGALYTYDLNVWIDDEGISCEETTPEIKGYKSLLIPYLRDLGGDYKTRVGVRLSSEGAGVRFQHGNEVIRVRVEGAIAHVLDLPHGFENRRGLCGLLRLDLRHPTHTLRYRVTIGR